MFAITLRVCTSHFCVQNVIECWTESLLPSGMYGTARQCLPIIIIKICSERLFVPKQIYFHTFFQLQYIFYYRKETDSSSPDVN